MGVSYHQYMQGIGFGGEADRVRQAFQARDRDGAARLVTDGMVDAMTRSSARPRSIVAVLRRLIRPPCHGSVTSGIRLPLNQHPRRCPWFSLPSLR